MFVLFASFLQSAIAMEAQPVILTTTATASNGTLATIDVVDPAGEPVAATVSVGQHSLGSTASTSLLLEPGRYLVVASAPGYQHGRASLVVSEGGASATVVMQPRPVRLADDHIAIEGGVRVVNDSVHYKDMDNLDSAIRLMRDMKLLVTIEGDGADVVGRYVVGSGVREDRVRIVQTNGPIRLGI